MDECKRFMKVLTIRQYVNLKDILKMLLVFGVGDDGYVTDSFFI